MANLSNHRNLYNGDFGLYFWTKERWQPEGGPFSREAIDRFVRLLAESGVDTFLLNPNTQVAWYPSKIVPTVIDGYVRGDDNYLGGTWGPDILDPYLDLIESGVNILTETIAACRRYGVSPWVSVRMNDMHWCGTPECKANSPLYPDPKYRLSGRSMNPDTEPNVYWQALNYERVEVRDYMFSMVKELVEDYGFEGLEIDWMRNPNCCEPGASPETTELITNWHADIRALTNAKAQVSGKDYPVGMRCPVSYKLFRSIGLDVTEMVSRGILDFVCPTNFMQTTWDAPYDSLREEFGDKVTIYGVSELMLNSLPGYNPTNETSEERNVCSHPAAVRANAAGKLVLGADGIEQYNFYWTHYNVNYAALKGLTELDDLRGQDKHYAIPSLGHPCHYFPYDMVEPLPAQLPSGSRLKLQLPMCAEPDDSGLYMIVQVVVASEEPIKGLGVSFNQSWPLFDGVATRELLFPNGPSTHIPPGHLAYNCRLGAYQIRDGWNEIMLFNHPVDGIENDLRVVSVELAVKSTIGAAK